MDPHGDLQRQHRGPGVPAPGERLPPAHRAVAVRDRPQGPGRGPARGRLQRPRARGRAEEGRERLRRIAALALAATLLLASPAAAANSRSVKRLGPGLTWTHIVRARGPLRVNVLTIDRARLRGRLAAVLSNGAAAGAERVSAMARRTKALAGVNGGFFGGDGNPVGALAVGGRLVSEPVAPRSALLVPTGRTAPRVAELRFSGSV